MVDKKNIISIIFILAISLQINQANAETWYDTNYPYRFEIQIPSTLTETIIFPINSTNGNILWTETTDETIYLYCNNINCSNDYVIANKTTEKRWEDANSTKGNQIKEMWIDHDFSIVYHFNNVSGYVNDSTGTNTFVSPINENISFNGTKLDGYLWGNGNNTGVGENNCYDITSDGLVTGNNDRTTIALLYSLDSSTNAIAPLHYGSNSDKTSWDLMYDPTETPARLELGLYGVAYDWRDTNVNLTDFEWTTISASWKGSTFANKVCALNSTYQYCNDRTLSAINTGDGYYDSSICSYSAGLIDEVFNLNATKSEDWIQNFSFGLINPSNTTTEYDNYYDTYITITYPTQTTYTNELNNSEIYVYDSNLTTFPVNIYNNGISIFSSSSYSNGTLISIDLQENYESNTISVIANGTVNRTNSVTFTFTSPKLNINFDKTTSGYVAHLTGGYNFTGTSVLLVQGNISTGEVIVTFDSNTQFYEYYNDQLTHINETMEVIEGNETLILRISDKSAGIIEGAIVRVSRLNETNYTLIHQGISNEEGETQTEIIDGDILKIEVLKDGYSLYYAIINSGAYSGEDNYYAVKLDSTSDMFYNNYIIEANHTENVYVIPMGISIFGFSFALHDYCFQKYINNTYESETCYNDDNEAEYTFTMSDSSTNYTISCYVDDSYVKNFTFVPTVYEDAIDNPDFQSEIEAIDSEYRYRVFFFPYILLLVILINVMKQYRREVYTGLSFFFTVISVNFAPLLILGFIMFLAQWTKEARGKG